MIYLHTHKVHVVGTGEQNQPRQLLVVESQQITQIQQVTTNLLPELIRHSLSHMLADAPVQLLEAHLHAPADEHQEDVHKVPHEGHRQGGPLNEGYPPG